MNKKAVKGMLVIFVICAILLGMVGCSMKSCEGCGKTPTKAYVNEAKDRKEYYCEYCTTSCDSCGRFADQHYTHVSFSEVEIKFVCEVCYRVAEQLGFVFHK